MDIYIDLDKVQRFVSENESILRDIEFIKQDLRLSKEEISDATWSGNGRRAFERAFEKWYRYTEEVQEYLSMANAVLDAFGQREAEILKKQGEALWENFEQL